jgi:peroxiredoxin
LHRIAAALCVAIAASPSATAQQDSQPTHGRSMHGGAFDEGPRQAAYAMSGMSEQVSMPIRGLDAEAQRFFDQGLCQLHGFWYFEAERSFRQVAQLRPETAMAYVGMALANVENPKRAASFAANAVRRSADLPRYERLWVDAYARFYRIDDAAQADLRSGDPARLKKGEEAVAKANEKREQPEKERLDRELIKDLGRIVHEFPEDIEAKARLALQIWLAYDWGGGVQIVSHAAVDALLDQVFAKAPRHPAHHFRVHLWDQEDAARALKSAAAIGDSAPGIAHQWHMAGHIYAKLHRHAEAAWQQEASARVDHAYQMRDRVPPYEIHNYGHNQEWLARSLSHRGRHAEALAVAVNLATVPRHPKRNRLSVGDDVAGDARVRIAQICEDHGLWTDVLRLVDEGVLDACDEAFGDALRIDLVGRALFRLGRTAEAERVAAEIDGLVVRARAERARALDKAEDEALAAKAARPDVDRALDEARRSSTDVVRAAFEVRKSLDGERLLAQGDAKGALAAFLAIEGFSKPLLADAHVAAGEPDKAIALMEAEVKAHPHRVPLLARLLIAYAAAAKPEHEARRAELAAELRAMNGATTPLLARAGVVVDPRPASSPSDPLAKFPDDFGVRPPLDSLGPLRWNPTAAPGFDLPVAGAGRKNLKDYAGRPVLVVFYLGFGCLHCVEQLRALSPQAAAFADMGVDVVAIGTDDVAGARASLDALSEADRFPFPLLADPSLAAFKAWRCFDDFERKPLHGTFFVDASGRVRWQDVSYEPFKEFDWLRRECVRLLALRPTEGAAESRPTTAPGPGGAGSK